MSTTIHISLPDDGASEVIAKVIATLSADGLTELNSVASREMETYLKGYHRDFQENDGWANFGLPTHGAGRKETRFGEDIARAWQIEDSNSSGFTLSNDATGFSHKVTGGKITAKKAKALTIPMVPEAHGVRARDYKNDLFRPKGKDYLMESLENGEARVVYLLRKSVTHSPVEGALPDDKILHSEFLESVVRYLDEEIK